MSGEVKEDVPLTKAAESLASSDETVADDSKKVYKEKQDDEDDEDENLSTWMKFRQSGYLVIIVSFCAFVIDNLLIFGVEPLLPDILRVITYPNSVTEWDARKMFKVENGKGGNVTGNNTYDYLEDSTRIGIIVAAKPAASLLTNFVAGYVVERFGHREPLIFGSFIQAIACVGFAFAPNFGLLLLARAIQGIGASFSVVPAMALVAHRFPGDAERSKVMGFVGSGVHVGSGLAFPFAALTYQFLGRRTPFYILAAMSVLDGIMRLFISANKKDKKKANGVTISDYWSILTDGYIIVAMAGHFAFYFAFGVFMATAPAWMMSRLHAEIWQMGIILFISVVILLTTQNITGYFAVTHGRWKFIFVSFILYGVPMFFYPLCKTIWEVIAVEFPLRVGNGIFLGIIYALLGTIVDQRHNSNYGVIYGLHMSFFTLAVIIGPLAGGFLLNYMSFSWLYRGTAIYVSLHALTALAFKKF
ncbi:synaptic vesicular amine transporter-like [Lineus longissimus]|uniref:synaptic vesicular amine transporter-like n=1 Tax=Lineus longissimus TaxID=88925 RepID=UPI002B4F4321